MSVRIKFIAYALISVLALLPANARTPDDAIAVYNAALATDDDAAQIAAARALIETALADPNPPTSTLIAFEGAWTLCRLDNCAGAAQGAAFAASQPGTGAHPLLADRQLLAALANWSDNDSRRTRGRLEDALKAVAPRRPTRLSATAYERRYLSRMAKERYEASARAANEALAHLEPFKAGLAEHYAQAQMTAIVASFLDDAELDRLEEITHLTGQLGEQMIDAARRGAPPEWLQNAYWRADAWRLVMETSFTRRRDEARVREIAALLKTYDSPEVIWGAADQTLLCPGAFDMTPELEYPRNAARLGRYGAVLIDFDISNGRVLNARVLAAVPSEAFRAQALETVRQWRWQADAEARPAGCSMSRQNVTIPIVFRLR